MSGNPTILAALMIFSPQDFAYFHFVPLLMFLNLSGDLVSMLRRQK